MAELSRTCRACRAEDSYPEARIVFNCNDLSKLARYQPFPPPGSDLEAEYHPPSLDTHRLPNSFQVPAAGGDQTGIKAPAAPGGQSRFPEPSPGAALSPSLAVSAVFIPQDAAQ